MPIVPFTGAPNVAPQPLSQVRQSSAGATPEAFGGGVARGLQALGQGLGQASQNIAQIVQIDAERDARDANTAFSQKRRELLYGTPEKPGFLQLTGADAVKSYDATAQDLEKIRQQINSDLSGPAQNIFDPVSQNIVQAELDRMAQHSITERKAANQATWKSSLLEANNLAAANPRDTAVLGEALATARSMARNLSLSEGNAPEVVAREMKTAETGVYLSAITSLAFRESSGEANIFYQGIKDQLDGQTQIKIEEDLAQLARTERASEIQEVNAARQALRDFQEAEDNENFNKFVEGTLDAKALAASGASPEDKRAMLSKIEEANSAGGLSRMRSDPSLVTQLWFQISPPDGSAPLITDDRQLDQYFGQDRVNATDMKMLRDELANKRGSPEGADEKLQYDQVIAHARRTMSYSNDFLQIRDADGDKNFMIWLSNFIPQYRAGRRAGKSPNALLRPDGPDSLTAGIELLRRSTPEILKSTARGARGNAGVEVPTQNAVEVPTGEAAPTPSVPGTPSLPATAAPPPTTQPSTKGSAAQPVIPAGAIDELRADPSEAAKREFELLFGKDALNRVLNNGR